MISQFETITDLAGASGINFEERVVKAKSNITTLADSGIISGGEALLRSGKCGVLSEKVKWALETGIINEDEARSLTNLAAMK